MRPPFFSLFFVSLILACGSAQAQDEKTVPKEGAPAATPIDQSVPPGVMPIEATPGNTQSVRVLASKPLPSSLALRNISQFPVVHRVSSDSIAIRGALSNDGPNGAPGGMLYFGAHPVGFLAQIFVHAVLQNSSNNSRMKAAQTEADKVVQPFLSLVERWSKTELIASAQTLANKQLENKTESTVSRKSLTPPFNMQNQLDFGFTFSQDLKSWLIDVVSGKTENKAKDELTSSVFAVRVIAPALTPEETTEVLLQNDGRLLKAKMIELLAEALILMPNEHQAPKSGESAERTIRFQDGVRVQIERGLLIAQDCERVIFKNLRSLIISAPRAAANIPADCKP